MAPENKERIETANTGAYSSNKWKLSYHIDEYGNAVIDRYYGNADKVELPSHIEGFPVAEIGFRAFWDGEAITEITLPETLICIGPSAFSGCTCLKEITIPRNTREIGAEAFCGCEDLVRVFLPEGLKTVGNGAFWHCDEIQGFVLPESLCYAGERAFANDILTSIRFPASLVELDGNPVAGSEAIRKVEIAEGNPALKWHDGLLVNELNRTAILALPNDKKRSYHVPEGIISIGSGAFSCCRYMTELKLPSTLENIEESAFSGCSGLYELIVPDNVSYIAPFAFSYCYNLTELWLPDSVRELSLFELPSYLHVIGGRGTELESFCTENGIPFICRDDEEGLKNINITIAFD